MLENVNPEPDHAEVHYLAQTSGNGSSTTRKSTRLTLACSSASVTPAWPPRTSTASSTAFRSRSSRGSPCRLHPRRLRTAPTSRRWRYRLRFYFLSPRKSRIPRQICQRVRDPGSHDARPHPDGRLGGQYRSFTPGCDRAAKAGPVTRTSEISTAGSACAVALRKRHHRAESACAASHSASHQPPELGHGTRPRANPAPGRDHIRHREASASGWPTVPDTEEVTDSIPAVRGRYRTGARQGRCKGPS